MVLLIWTDCLCFNYICLLYSEIFYWVNSPNVIYAFFLGRFITLFGKYIYNTSCYCLLSSVVVWQTIIITNII
jgi:hypothetical protein